jgi:hypothetical protein
MDGQYRVPATNGSGFTYNCLSETGRCLVHVTPQKEQDLPGRLVFMDAAVVIQFKLTHYQGFVFLRLRLPFAYSGGDKHAQDLHHLHTSGAL